MPYGVEWRPSRGKSAALALAGIVAAAGVLLRSGGGPPEGSAAPLPPVYLTIVSHNEEPLAGSVGRLRR